MTDHERIASSDATTWHDVYPDTRSLRAAADVAAAMPLVDPVIEGHIDRNPA